MGEERSPTWEDWEQLPYVRMIQKEVLRWRPVRLFGSVDKSPDWHGSRQVLPIGVPHYLEKDENYKGMFLPSGSVVLLNAWACQMDKSKWGGKLSVGADPYRY